MNAIALWVPALKGNIQNRNVQKGQPQGIAPTKRFQTGSNKNEI